MGTFLNELLVKTSNLNKKDFFSIARILDGKYKYDFDYDELCINDDFTALPIYNDNIDCLKIGKDIADKYKITVISIYIYDSDFAIFQLADVNTIIRIVFNKELASSYDYDINDQNIEILVNYIDNNHTIDDIKEIIDNEYTFAEDGISKLLELFNIDFSKVDY